MIELKIVPDEQAAELAALHSEGVVSITGGHEYIRVAFYNPEDEVAFRLKYEHKISSLP